MVKFSSLFATALAVVTLASCSKESYTFRNSAPYGTTYTAAVKAQPVTEAAAPAAEATAEEAPAAELTASTVAAPVAKQHAVRTVKVAKVAETKAAPTRAEVKEAKATLKAVHKAAKKANAAAPMASGKSQLVALLLAIFLGGLSIHRFYLGYTGLAFLQILTVLIFGIGFIWVLIDIIRIATGSLKPKDGDYSDKL